MNHSSLWVKCNKKALYFCLSVASIMLMEAVFAHGVAGKDAAYLQQNNGQALSVFLYLGAKHMVTGYDHLLYLCGVIFFLNRLKDVALFAALPAMIVCVHCSSFFFAYLQNSLRLEINQSHTILP